MRNAGLDFKGICERYHLRDTFHDDFLYPRIEKELHARSLSGVAEPVRLEPPRRRRAAPASPA